LGDCFDTVAPLGGLTVEKVPYSMVFARKSPRDCRRWKKRGDTSCARRHVMGFCAQGTSVRIPPCTKRAGPSAAEMGYRYLYARMTAEGVRVVCGRCVFKGDTFRTRNALQVAVGQYDCGRCAAQKHTFRKSIGDLPQKQRISERITAK